MVYIVMESCVDGEEKSFKQVNQLTDIREAFCDSLERNNQSRLLGLSGIFSYFVVRGI